MSSNPLLFLSSIAMLAGTKREASSSEIDSVQSLKNQREDDIATVMTSMSSSSNEPSTTMVNNKPVKGLLGLKKQHHQHESKLKENLLSSQNAWSCAVPWSLFPTKVVESPYKSADVPSICPLGTFSPLMAAAASLESSSSSSSSSTGSDPSQSMPDHTNNIRNIATTTTKNPPVLAGVGATVVVATSTTNPTMAGRLMTYLERSRSNLHGNNNGVSVPGNEPHGQPTQGHPGFGVTKLSIMSPPQVAHGFVMRDYRSRSSSGVSSVGSIPMAMSGKLMHFNPTMIILSLYLPQNDTYYNITLFINVHILANPLCPS